MADVLKYGFITGELAPRAFGRSDLEKFDMALAKGKNWIVDYLGGIATRNGFEWVDYVKNDQYPTKFFRFRFSPDDEDTYVLLFYEGGIRFLQSGGYVLEGDKTITGITLAAPGVVTAVGHGYVTGDWVQLTGFIGPSALNNRLFEVGATTTNTFALRDPFGNNFSTIGFPAYVSGGIANRVYTIASPYASGDLEKLSSQQVRDTLRLTHPNYAPRDLTRLDHTNWVLVTTNFDNAVTSPVITAITPSASGSAGVGFAITAVVDGQESPPSPTAFNEAIKNYTATAGSVEVTWSPVAGAKYYNVYRTVVSNVGSEVSNAMELGFLGRAFGPRFVDNNIVPDFTVTPPRENNPFAAGQITHINIGASGSGYPKTSVMTITDGTGSGAAGFPVVDDGGQIVGVVLTRGGKNYSNPSISFSGGTGATATAVIGPSSGVFPSVSALFQQRQIYAASIAFPQVLWASRPGELNSFFESIIVTEGDSYEFELDSEEISPIRHLISMRGGMIVMSQTGVWQLTGGASGAVSALNAIADFQSYSGVAKLVPVKIDTDLVYLDGTDTTVRMLAYNDFSKLYVGTDISILSTHLFSKKNPIKAWTYANQPSKVVWGVRADGTLIFGTIVKEQNVFGWTWGATRGKFCDVVSIDEDGESVVYVMTSRLINGRWTKFIERSRSREIAHVEDAFCVDAGATTVRNTPNATLTASAVSGTVTFTASAAVFSVDDVDKVLRMGGGKFQVTQFISSTQVVGISKRSIVKVIPDDPLGRIFPAAAGEWTLDPIISSVTNAYHLEGETVSVLVDGNVSTPKVVVNGSFSFPPGSRVTYGLGFRCEADLIPPSLNQVIIDDKRKREVAVAVRMNESRGLLVGTKGKLYPFKERTTENYGEPTELQSGMRHEYIDPSWEIDTILSIVQEDPLPANVLTVVRDVELGDGD